MIPLTYITLHRFASSFLLISPAPPQSEACFFLSSSQPTIISLLRSIPFQPTTNHSHCLSQISPANHLPDQKYKLQPHGPTFQPVKLIQVEESQQPVVQDRPPPTHRPPATGLRSQIKSIPTRLIDCLPFPSDCLVHYYCIRKRLLAIKFIPAHRSTNNQPPTPPSPFAPGVATPYNQSEPNKQQVAPQPTNHPRSTSP